MSQLKLFLFVLLFGGLAVAGQGCASDCAGDEVCAFSTFGKNGFIEDCLCVEAECDVDEDCDPGFFCDNGLCVQE